MSNHDTYLTVQAALTYNECKLLFNRFTDKPYWCGADVADVLAQLCDTDAHLDVIDSMHDALSDLPNVVAFVRPCTLAMLYVDGIADPNKVRSLVLMCRALESK